MADKRITDFATAAEAQDDDLLLISSEDETYNIKVKTIKDAVQGNAERAEAAAKAAQKAAESAAEDADTSVRVSTEANGKSEEALANASTAALNAAAAAASASDAATSAANAEQALINATDAVADINEFAEDVDTIKATLAQKADDARVDEEGHLYLTSDGEDIAGPFGPFAGGAGGGGGSDVGSVIRIVNGMPSRSISVMSGESCVIKYSWTSLDTQDQTPIGSGTATWRVNNTIVATRTVEQGDNTFDVTSYLATASNAVKLTIEDAYGNTKSFTWTVTVTVYNLTWNVGELAVHGISSLVLRLVPSGDGAKTVHVTVDESEVFNQVVNTTGRSVSVTVPAQKHGAHVIKAWLEANVNGAPITTPALRHVGIWTEAGNSTPVIAVYNDTVEIPQYSTGAINYMVYSPNSLTTDILLLEGFDTLSSLTVDRQAQVWAYRATSSGEISLTIRTKDGSVSAKITVTVSSLGYDIHPVTENLVLDIDPTGHSNNEASRETFGYKDGEGENHPFTFSENFDWINGGFQLDDEGVTAFLIKRGTTVTLDRSLFTGNATQTGKEIKAIFKASNVRNYDAEMLSCLSGGIGLTLQAQQAVLKSELKSITIPYCEDTKIELDVNIESSSENRIATVWLRGVPSRGFFYTSSDNWTQATPANVVIGSEDCDIWLYRMKLYDASLTRYEILDNFIADCGNAEEMIARYKRNDIFNPDNTINITNLANANPTLRVIKIGAERLTTGKSDPVTCSVELTYIDGGNEKCFTATNAVMKVQGTSSAAYGESAYNLDLDFSSATWQNGNGEPITEGYAMTENSIPVDYFNVKLNVASSENANNVCLADDYNEFQPFLTDARRKNNKVRDTIEGHPCVVFFTNTGSAATPAGSHTVSPNETVLYGCGDMNNSKKNYAVFGQDDKTYPEQCCIEFLNNTSAQCRFQSDDLTEEQYDGDGNFEFRYPKSPTAAHKAAFQKMLSWVVSTDTSAATNEELHPIVEYGDDSYTNDTAEYRAAKFVNEFSQYFSKDAMTYHYLFTERHCMIDNRAKNVFFSYEYDPDASGYRWNVCKDYDNDTADGNDNEGGLTFTYGIEDTDSVGTKKAFNASDSVLWCNIRDYMRDDLEAMFKDREAAGAWSASRILAKFAAHQAARPEALVMEDMWGKYYDPYINKGNSGYVDMMQGNKTDQRTQFEIYQERYASTEYYGSVATSDAITFRGNTPEDWTGVRPTGDLEITPYSDMYIIVKYGSFSIRTRAKRNQKYTIKCPMQDALSDTEIYIYAASNVTEIGSIAGLYCQYINLGNATRLRRFIGGSAEVGYANKNLTSVDFANNTMLEHLDLRGTPDLTTALDLSGLTALKEIYLAGSGVTGVTFAVGAPVETAELCALQNLIARRLSKLSTFTMSGVNLRSIWVEESPVIDTFTLVDAALNLTRGRLPGVAWSVNNADTILRLASLAGLDESGELSDAFVLTGSAYVAALAQTELTAIRRAFTGLSVTYGEIVPTFTVTFQNWDGQELNKQTVRQFGAAVNPITAGLIETPTRESTVETVYTFRGWDIPFNYILQDTIVKAEYLESVRTYTVKFWNSTVLLQTNTVDVHTRVEYTGEPLSAAGGALWVGWDALTDDVVKDMDVHAVFMTPRLPDAVAHDYDFLYSDNEEDNSGYSLAEFYGIITSGKVENYFSVGDKIKIVPHTNVFADSEIVLSLAGYRHYKITGQEDFATCTFVMVGVMNAMHRMNATNSNAGGWEACEMREWLNDTIFHALPVQWQTMIKAVDVKSSVGETKPEIVTSSDKLFLLSQAEVGFNTGDVPYKNEIDSGAEQVTFPIFTDNNSRIKKLYNGEGTAQWWWLRSPLASSSSGFCGVNYGYSTNYFATGAYGVALGFCI